MPPADPNSPRLGFDAYVLDMKQQPTTAKAIGAKIQDRKPVDPPPILRLMIRDPKDPAQNYLQSPYYICVAQLWDEILDREAIGPNNSASSSKKHPALAGTLVSSLHKLKDPNNEDGGFFVFGDMSVRYEGRFRLRFVLWEMLEGEAISLQSVVSDAFTVYPAKSFPGLAESSFLSRSFGDQGVRLRIRKDGRSAKRIAKQQHVNDDTEYDAKSQSAISPTSQNDPFNDPSNYSRSFTGDQGFSKRQRSSGDYGQAYDRDTYFSTTPSSTARSTSTTFSQEVVPATQQMSYAYRGRNPSEALITQAPSSMYLGRPVSDYTQNPSAYMPRSAYGQDDTSEGLTQYNDANNSFGLQNTDAGSPLSPTSNQNYPSITLPSSRSSYNSMTGLGSGTTNMLPPVPSYIPPSTSVTLPSSYGASFTDGRYSQQTGSHSNKRGSDYSHPTFPLPSSYQSTS